MAGLLLVGTQWETQEQNLFISKVVNMGCSAHLSLQLRRAGENISFSIIERQLPHPTTRAFFPQARRERHQYWKVKITEKGCYVCCMWKGYYQSRAAIEGAPAIQVASQVCVHEQAK